MRLVYIFHSGFVMEGTDFSILIDYYRDTPDRFVQEKFLKSSGRLYILASHVHADHFNPEILTWKEKRPDICYIFSEDIREKQKACFHDAVFLKKGEEWNDDRLKVKAFGSTDAGISFFMDAEDKRIFHAGDLNNWHWKEESEPVEIEEAERNYLNELEILARYTNDLDVALFPVDPRLGKDYMLGAKQFVDRILVRQFVPMHFGDKYDEANAFRTYAEEHGGRFMTIHRPGESMELEER